MRAALHRKVNAAKGRPNVARKSNAMSAIPESNAWDLTRSALSLCRADARCLARNPWTTRLTITDGCREGG